MIVENINTIETDFSVKVVPSKRKKVKKASIELSGDLSIVSIVEIQKQFRKLMDEYDLIDVLLTSVDKLDLATIQMLFVNSEIHSDEKRQVKVIADLPKNLKQLVQQNGFSEFIYEHKR